MHAPPAQAVTAAPGQGSTLPQLQALRAELESLKPRALRIRAVADGVSAETVDGADDAEDVKAALVAMILHHNESCWKYPAHQEAQERAQLRLELSALRPRALRVRAAEMGIDDEVVDGADDADDVKEALIRILLDHMSGAGCRASGVCG